MANTSITIRMDEALKKEAEKLFSEMGLNMTTAITVFAKAVVRQKKIPFEISLNIPNDETVEAMNDVNNHNNLSKTFNDVNSLMEDLNA